MTNRCPKCGKNNYGDVQKCSFCGAPLVFIPGEEIPQVKEEDIQEKLSNMKVERIRNPVMIGGGGIVAVIGLFLAIALFLIFMIFVFSPSDVKPTMMSGSIHYEVPGGEEYIFGEITMIVKDGLDAESKSYGYYEGYYAYEMEGDGKDHRSEEDIEKEPDVWFYSNEKIGEVGDTILIKVRSEPNKLEELRAVNQGKAPWGGTGWILSGWIFLLPGVLMLLIGVTISVIGIIGKADRSMERLMEEDKEFRRQQLMLREAARKQMEARQKQSQWTSYTAPIEAEPATPPTGLPMEQVQTGPVWEEGRTEIPPGNQNVPFGAGSTAQEAGISGGPAPQQYVPPQYEPPPQGVPLSDDQAPQYAQPRNTAAASQWQDPGQ
ncbi:MAG: hypothetical protein JW939_05205 [Candidatus Thermoplasmatota archaeon]|nr:hypothetical protein [Candidatus Thermoplasmatota archaeon]